MLEISDEAVRRLVRVMDEILGSGSESGMKEEANGTGGEKKELELEGMKMVDASQEVEL